MSADHTQGRLRAGMNGAFSQDTPPVYLFTDETFGDLVASLSTSPMRPTAEADTRRLAAAWNACQGLTTEALESSDVLSAALGAQRALEAQRDELLAALRRLSAAGLARDTTMGDPCRLIEVKAELFEAVKDANAVISRTTP